MNYTDFDEVIVSSVADHYPGCDPLVVITAPQTVLIYVCLPDFTGGTVALLHLQRSISEAVYTDVLEWNRRHPSDSVSIRGILFPQCVL